MTKKLIFLALSLLIFSTFLFGWTKVETASSQTGEILYGGYPFVAVYDLKQAGYTYPEAKADGGQMPVPAPQYFLVKERVTGYAATSNVVMVYHYISPYAIASLDGLYAYAETSQALFIEGGFGKETQLVDRRFVVSLVKGKDYVVAIGPDKAKLENLAISLAKKIK